MNEPKIAANENSTPLNRFAKIIRSYALLDDTEVTKLFAKIVKDGNATPEEKREFLEITSLSSIAGKIKDDLELQSLLNEGIFGIKTIRDTVSSIMNQE